jgi:hypothetical protein
MSFRKIKTALSRLKALPWVVEDLQSLSKRLTKLSSRVESVQEALGRIELRQLSAEQSNELAAKELRVFSQWGEDGIIQFLISRIRIDNRRFVEFGVEDYTQANTRFLLLNNNWRGLVIDSDRPEIERLQRSAVCWQYGLKAVASHVTAENINELLSSSGFTGEIGLLSIDIDGNDYWVWRAISVIDPVIVIVEYNHRFGSDAAVTIPYDKDFQRGQGHPIFYFGASLKALCGLAARKGYAFVGCNSNGVNAFFVRRDKLPPEIKELSPAEGYVAGRFSEARDEQQRFIIYQPEEERLLLMDQPLVKIDDEN